MNFVFNNPTKLLFGTGKLGELHKETFQAGRRFFCSRAGSLFTKTVPTIRQYPS
jgi:alcohol dehydrogenase YqhD (iron-dependent ADH family)